MRKSIPIALILVGIGIGLLGLVFGEPLSRGASFRTQLEDMPIFGVESFQYKWVLTASICLVLIGVYFYATEKNSN